MSNQRKLNLPFLAGLLTIPFVVAGLVHLLHNFQMVRNASTFLRQARRAQESNTPDSKGKALTYLERYVKLAPKDPEGQILLGLQYAEVNRFHRGAIHLQSGLGLQPERPEARRRLVDCLMQLGRFTDAIEQIENYLLKETPKDSELLQKLAICQRAKQDFEQAEKTIRLSIKSSPDRLEPYEILASLLHEKLGRTKDAVIVINEMVSVNPENSKAYLYRGRWFKRQFDEFKNPSSIKRLMNQSTAESFLQNAESDVNESLKRDPDDAEVLMFASRVNLELGKRDELRQLLIRGIELHPNRPGFYSMLSNLESESGHSVEAIESMRKGSQAVPQILELQWNLARLLIESGNMTEAKEIIAQLYAKKYPVVALEFLEGRILFLNKEWLRLIQKFESRRGLLAPTPETIPLFRQAEYMLGIAYGEINSTDMQIQSFRRCIAIDPDWMLARLKLAESLSNAEQIQEAVSEYSAICGMPNAPQSALIGLANSLALLNRNKLPEFQDWREFNSVVGKLEQLDPQSAVVAMLQSQKLRMSYELEEASKLIRSARERSPDVFDLWRTEFDFAESKRDTTLMTQLAEDVESQFGDSVNVRQLKGRSIVLKLRSSDEARSELRKLAEPPESWTESQKIQLAQIFAPFFLSIEDHNSAEELALLVEKVQPKNVRMQLILLEVGFQSKQLKQIDRALEALKAIEGEGADWHFGQARRLIFLAEETKDKNAYREAVSHLEKAKALRPTNSQYVTLAAKLLSAEGDQQASLGKYLEAIRLGEKSPDVTGRAIALLVGFRKLEEANKLIEDLRESRAPFTEEMARIAVSVSLQLGNRDVALKSLEQLVRDFQGGSDPKWIGLAYLDVEKYDLAEAKFRAALAINSGDPDLWVALIQSFARRKQFEKVDATIEEAKQAIPEDKSDLAIGQCYEIAGKGSLADEFYQKAIERSPDNPLLRRKRIDFQMNGGKLREAETALRDLLEQTKGTDEASQNTRQWADLRLARCLLKMGGSNRMVEALNIVDQNIQNAGNYSPDLLRLKAGILTAWPTRLKRQEAIAILQKLVLDETTATAEDHWELARLYYLSEGELTKSLSELRKAIVSKDDPRYYILYVLVSLKLNDLNSDLERYIGILQKRSPNDPDIVDLQAQILYARKNFPEIVNLLKKFVSTGVTAKEKPELVHIRKYLAAKKFESFGIKLTQDKEQTKEKNAFANQYFVEAETLLNQNIKDNPDDITWLGELTEFLAVTPQIDRVLDLLQEHGAKFGARRIVEAVRRISKNPAANTEQLKRVQEQLAQFQELVAKKSLNDPPKSILLTLADLMTWRGDSKGAQAIYRGVLKESPENIIALNNLAVSLALNSGDTNAAMSSVKKAIEYGGPMDALLDTQGLVELYAGHSQAAIVLFKQAVFEKDSAENQFHLADAYARSGQFNMAKETLAIADKLGLVEQELTPKERDVLKKLRKQLDSK